MLREQNDSKKKRKELSPRKHVLLRHPIYVRARASIEQREAPIRKRARERAYAHKYLIQAHKAHAYTHARNDAQRRQRKSPSDQQCGNSERLRAALCESRTTRAATNDLLISLSLRARSSRCTNFPEHRNRTVDESSPDVLRIGLTLPLFPTILSALGRTMPQLNATAIRSP